MSFFQYFLNLFNKTYEINTYSFTAYESIGDYAHRSPINLIGFHIPSKKLFVHIHRDNIYVRKINKIENDYKYIKSGFITNFQLNNINNIFKKRTTLQKIENKLINEISEHFNESF
jgi:hypothetical protein